MEGHSTRRDTRRDTSQGDRKLGGERGDFVVKNRRRDLVRTVVCFKTKQTETFCLFLIENIDVLKGTTRVS